MEWKAFPAEIPPADTLLVARGTTESGKTWHATAYYVPASDDGPYAFFDEADGEELWPPTHFLILTEPA